MSKQTNFLADVADNECLHDWLAIELRNWLFIRTDRGTLDEFEPIPIATALREAEMPKKSFLIAADGVNRLQLTPRSGKESEYVLHPALNPVLEYSPSRILADGLTCHVGRFYWASNSELNPGTGKAVSRLMRWIRESTKPVTSYERFRVFPHAALHAVFLKFWAVDSIPNPFRTQSDITSLDA